MNRLLQRFYEVPVNRLEKAELDSVDSTRFGSVLPGDAREFFATFSGGVFIVTPLELRIIHHALERSVNDWYVDDYYSQTFSYYDECILFASAVGYHFSSGLDLNEMRRGGVVGYEDEGLVVSKSSYYLLKSFSDWLEHAIASTRETPVSMNLLADSPLGPVLR